MNNSHEMEHLPFDDVSDEDFIPQSMRETLLSLLFGVLAAVAFVALVIVAMPSV
jgi:hypothetical protein